MKSSRIFGMQLHRYSHAAHSKCRYKLRKSRLMVPTTPYSSSTVKVLAWINPGVYS